MNIILSKTTVCPKCQALAWKDFSGSGEWYTCSACANYFDINDPSTYGVLVFKPLGIESKPMDKPNFAVYYRVNPTWRDKGVTLELVQSDAFKKVCEIIALDDENVFEIMQGFNWSPNGEARELIQSLGLKHTSMSHGDALQDLTTGKFHVVAACGFREALPKAEDPANDFVTYECYDSGERFDMIRDFVGVCPCCGHRNYQFLEE